MEPLNDQELDELLKQWPGRPAPETLAVRIRRARRGPWWHWLLTGTIRVPVPLAFALGSALIAMLVFVALRSPQREAIRQPQGAVFQPVKRLEPRIIRSSYETNN
jgi:hypothetical protein